MQFHIDEIDRDVLILQADGGLNGQTAPQFLGELEKVVDAGIRKVIVDCTKLNYVSSYGLGVLLRVHKRLRKRGGDVKICCVKGVVNEILRTMKLDRIFETYPDVNRARLAFRPREG